MAETEAGPQLQAPGAGLPRVEALLTRIGFRLGTPFLSRNRASQWFRAETEQILSLVRGLTPERGAKRVLIKRIGGLEDSSRFWSAYMALEHLVIVNESIAGVIETLASGRTVAQAVSTAAVKPHPGADASFVERFAASADGYSARVERIADLRTKLTHKHPWFGELSVIGWHRLAAIHLGIHRKQIGSVIRGLDRPALS